MTAGRGDYFDRARVVAVTLLVLASVTAIAGSFMEWTTRGVLPSLPETTFDGPAPEPTAPVTGVEAGEGNRVIAAAIVILVAATMLGSRRRAGWAWLAFIASVVIGAISIAAWRGIDRINSGFSQRIDVVSDIDPAAGLVVVAIAAGLGLVGSVLGVVATPSSAGAPGER